MRRIGSAYSTQVRPAPGPLAGRAGPDRAAVPAQSPGRITALNIRARTARCYAEEAASLLPPPPSSRVRAAAAALDLEWELLVVETAEAIAATVRHDREALCQAAGPAPVAGPDPAWRVLLALATRTCGGGADGVTTRELRIAYCEVSA